MYTYISIQLWSVFVIVGCVCLFVCYCCLFVCLSGLITGLETYTYISFASAQAYVMDSMSSGQAIIIRILSLCIMYHTIPILHSVSCIYMCAMSS